MVVETQALGQLRQTQMHLVPKVTIGMPVYNGEADIRAALNSLLEQTFTDFELIISDNASSDATEAICREYVERDARIQYVRQLTNRGPTENFQFLLNEAKGEYFMWAAVDDVRSPDYLEKNIEYLSYRSDYVASTSKTFFCDRKYNSILMGDFAIDDVWGYGRILSFFKGYERFVMHTMRC